MPGGDSIGDGGALESDHLGAGREGFREGRKLGTGRQDISWASARLARATAEAAQLADGVRVQLPGIGNGDFEAYWAFHLRCEHDRVHQARCQDGYDLIA